MAKKVLDALKKKFGSKVISTDAAFGDEVITVAAADLVAVAEHAQSEPSLAFDAPVFVTCIDRFGEDPRFEVCFQLRSTKHRHRLRIKVPVGAKSPKLPTLSGLWPGFDWQERETFDMYGIEFEGHPDLRRIYLYDEFVGHPLRKDYPKDKRQPLVRRNWDE